MAVESQITDDLNVICYNCEAVKRSTDYINDLLSNSECDILCLPETWLLE